MSDFILQERTLGDILDAAVAKYPDQEALVYADRDYRQTWAEFSTTVDDLAKGLIGLGVQPGEKVAIWATNVPHWVTLMFATARIGAVLITVNTSYRDTELSYILKHAECENIFIIDSFHGHDFIDTIYKVVPELRTQQRGHLKCETLPHLKRVLFLGLEKHRGMYSLPEVFAMSVMTSAQEYSSRKSLVKPHDVVNMQYTSGTTGFPKGVMLTHVGIANNGYWIGENQKLSSKDRVCIPVPLFHCFGCVLGVMACVNHASTMVILETFSPLHVMMAIESEKCTSIYGVPTMYLAIVENKNFSRFDYSSLRTGIMSGAICPEPLMHRVLGEMNVKELTIPYGLTENSPVMTMTTTSESSIDRRCQTVGQPMPGIEVIIKDPETGEDMPINTQGEICCRGYSVMKGYYKMPEATAEAIDKEGWLHTGDIGVLDEDNYLRITGRIKDMVVRGGENIYPREVEEFLLTMPSIQDVQVVAVMSRKYGEEVGAFILPREGETILAEDVRDFCRGHIAWHKIPRFIANIKEFPQTASGKIQKYKLREMAAELFPEAMD